MSDRDFSIAVPKVDEVKAFNSFVEWLRSNKNNFSYWFPKICHCFDGNDNIVVPKSLIIPIPENMLECFFGEKPDDYNIVSEWFNENIQKIREAFPDNTELFIKNGCFSGKFDFDNSCHIKNVNVETLVKNFMSLSMDSLCFDTGGNLELVIREYISPKEETPAIYNGMPFRPEIRLFYDFSKKQFCGESFYWDWDYCHNRICDMNYNDGAIYEKNYDAVYSQYEQYRDKWIPEIITILNNSEVDLSGVWSMDFILEEERAIMIDMAVGQDSAYYKEEYG